MKKNNILQTKPLVSDQKMFWIIQRRLDYNFISQNLQERKRNVDILNAVSTDHSPAFCLSLNGMEFPRGPGISKFNYFLIFDSNFIK